MVLLMVLAFCVNGLALVVGIIALAVCKDPEARRRARLIVIVSAIITGLAVFFQIVVALGEGAI